MIYELRRNTNDTYNFYFFEKPEEFNYIFAIIVSYRGNGEFEAHSWNSAKMFAPKATLSEWGKAMLWLHNELANIDKRFEKLIGNFESDRLIYQKRLFKSVAELEVLRSGPETHNGKTKDMTIVEFVFKNNDGLFGDLTY